MTFYYKKYSVSFWKFTNIDKNIFKKIQINSSFYIFL